MNFLRSRLAALTIFPAILPISGNRGALSAIKNFQLSFDLPLILSIFGGILCCFLILWPVSLLWFVTIFTLVVSGLIEYFLPSYWAVRWLAYFSAFVLFWPSLFAFIRQDTGMKRVNARGQFYAGFAFLLIVVISTLRASPPFKQVIVAAKSLFPFFGVYAFFAWYPIRNGSLKNWMKGVLCIGMMQIPFVLFQYIVFRGFRVARGGGPSSADSVVGTIGGNPLGGGLSGALALFIVSQILIILSFLREKEISRCNAVSMISLFTIPIIFSEVKIVFFYIPVGLFVLYYSTLKTKPKRFFYGSTVVIIVLAVGLFAYQTLHWSAKKSSVGKNQIVNGVMTYTISKFSYSFKSKPESKRIGLLSRRGAIEFWWQEHKAGSVVDIILGHGIGSSRSNPGGIIRGQMAVKHEPMRIDRTGLSVFLWDTGILGVFLLFSTLTLGYFRLNTIRKRLNSWERALAIGLQSLFPLYAMSFLYVKDIPYTAPVMFLLMVSFGLTERLGKIASDKTISIK